MATEIYIVSGFLGAGKTTLIQKLLKEAFQKDKVVLIENDFGEISVDAALLKSGGIEVKEINSGCICCSLSGDFVKALKELLDRFHPDKIIIEPSGVGKLSDVRKACSDPRIQPIAEVKAAITVADVKRCKIYLDNFGEFFEDQIQNADVILLSRTEDFPGKINDAYKLMKSLNSHSAILSKPWEQISAAEILYPQAEHLRQTEPVGHGRGYGPQTGEHGHSEHGNHSHGWKSSQCCEHDHAAHDGHGHGTCSHMDHGHDHNNHPEHHHNHSAEEAFDTVTIRTKRVFSVEDLKTRISNMERGAKGTILRAKGIVRSPNGYMNLQYLPGDIRITNCTAGGNMICIIGRDLNRQELVDLFRGEG